MVQRTVWFDDIELQADRDVEAVIHGLTFALEGQVYEIDLGAENAMKLKAVFEPFIAAARKAGTTASVTRIGRQGRLASVVMTPAPARDPDESAERTAIREWCRSVGLEIGDKGRISTAHRRAHARRNLSTGEPHPSDLDVVGLVWTRKVGDPAPPKRGKVAKPQETEPEPEEAGLPEVRYAETKEEFRAAALAWARAKGMQIAPRGFGIAPGAVTRFSAETGLYKPREKAAS